MAVNVARGSKSTGMAVRFETLPAADGRPLDVMLGGADTGPALLLHHGTPSDASLFSGWDEIARARELRLIAVSRPGYAGSARHPKRRVADVVDDVWAVIGKLRIPWFVTAGWSGGGPHALACAAGMNDRCRAAATLAGLGAYEMDDLDFLEGMGPENIDEFGAALSSEEELREWLERNATSLRDINGRGLAKAFGGLVPQKDKDALNGAFADRMAASIRRGLARNFDGWIDDDLAFVSEWGFELAEITVPVTVWQGDLDLMVPAAHGDWLAKHIPTAVARKAPGDGHISLLADYAEAIVNDLLSRAGGPSPRS
jgi:pimeloyl-ACP methyl ester carboxylesterase